MASTSSSEDVSAEEEPVTQEEEDENDDLTINADQPCRVHDIHIRGNQRTKEQVIERELAAARRAQTFGELYAALIQAERNLQSRNLFESVLITMDEGPSELPDTANIYVTVAENQVLSARVGSYVKGTEKTVEGNVVLRNAVGYAEEVTGQFSCGLERSSTFGLGLHWPHVLDAPGHLHSGVQQTWKSLERHASHTETQRGASVSYQQGRHELGYELTWRHNRFGGAPSPAIRRMLGHSLLSGIHYSYTVDELDDKIRPQNGYMVAARTTLAGLGPGPNLVRFAKQEVEAKGAYPLGVLNAALVGSLHAGVLLPWSARGQPSLINDRFFLGGAIPVRGFKSYGLGPVAARPDDAGWDRLGGDLMLAATAALSFDLPVRILQQWGVQGHAFLCAANLLPLSAAAGMAQTPREGARKLAATTRLSAGVGLVLPLRVLGRVEVNYCWILRRQEKDRAVGQGLRGFQICLNG